MPDNIDSIDGIPLYPMPDDWRKWQCYQDMMAPLKKYWGGTHAAQWTRIYEVMTTQLMRIKELRIRYNWILRYWFRGTLDAVERNAKLEELMDQMDAAQEGVHNILVSINRLDRLDSYIEASNTLPEDRTVLENDIMLVVERVGRDGVRDGVLPVV